MKTLAVTLGLLAALSATPALAAGSTRASEPASVATSVSNTNTDPGEQLHAQMKDSWDKLKQQQKDQRDKLKVQQKDERDRLRVDQKAQRDKLKAEQRAQWQKFRDSTAQEDTTPAPVKTGKR